VLYESQHCDSFSTVGARLLSLLSVLTYSRYAGLS
jgi:hypothetical protein